MVKCSYASLTGKINKKYCIKTSSSLKHLYRRALPSLKANNLGAKTAIPTATTVAILLNIRAKSSIATARPVAVDLNHSHQIFYSDGHGRRYIYSLNVGIKL